MTKPRLDELFDAVSLNNAASFNKIVEENPSLIYCTDGRTCFKTTVFHLAITKGANDILEDSLSRAPELINAKNWTDKTPLHKGALIGNVEGVELLLAAGANPTLRDIRGNRPSDEARSGGYAALEEKLKQAEKAYIVKYGEDPSSSQTPKKRFPFLRKGISLTGLKPIDAISHLFRGRRQTTVG